MMHPTTTNMAEKTDMQTLRASFPPRTLSAIAEKKFIIKTI